MRENVYGAGSVAPTATQYLPLGTDANAKYVYIIDGTGPSDNAEYKLDMNRGFCYKLSQQISDSNYSRGPTNSGLTTFDIADVVLKDIKLKLKVNPNVRLFLAGHSRGGAAVIYIAKELQKAKVSVQAMFLFDAVDRTLQATDLQTIPNNVKSCYHAMRDRTIQSYYDGGVQKYAMHCTALQAQTSTAFSGQGNVIGGTGVEFSSYSKKVGDDCDKMLDYITQSKLMHTNMRNTTNLFRMDIDFGNCGTDCEAGCELISERFLGSHGALGGAPMATHPLKSIRDAAPRLLANSDMAAMACVDAWMSMWLIKEGLFTSGQTILKHKYA